MRPVLLVCAAGAPLCAHDPITTKLTWSKEISPIFRARCMSCHQAGGRAPFPLTSYAETRPWAVAIRDEVARRAMPPWNAVKGFGDFANDGALSQEEISLIIDWVNGGAPQGEAQYEVKGPPQFWAPATLDRHRVASIQAARFAAPTLLAGVRVKRMREGGEARLVLAQPDGAMEPLAWIRNFRSAYNQPLLFRVPIRAAKGARILVFPERAGTFEVLTSRAE